jgi:hypothetical protein
MRPQNSFILLFTIITFQTASFTSAQTLLKNALQPNVCTYDILPSSPRNLVLIPKDKAIEAKWWSPSNKPCEVTYEVAIFGVGGVGKMAAVEVKETRVILTGLNNDLVYDILVTVREISFYPIIVNIRQGKRLPAAVEKCSFSYSAFLFAGTYKERKKPPYPSIYLTPRNSF